MSEPNQFAAEHLAGTIKNEVEKICATSSMYTQAEKTALVELQDRLLATCEGITYAAFTKRKERAKAAIKAEADAARELTRRYHRAMINARRKAKRLAGLYSIEIEDDSERLFGEYEFKKWVSQPNWLIGDDPLEDGHYAHDWHAVLWLVEFYAKHHPDHPDHAARQFEAINPHC
jgi:hypothetical protein